jgi:hypothetical protein
MNMEKICALLDRAGHPLNEGQEPIKQLYVAFATVLDEREQLMRDLRNVATRYNSCECCVHDPYESLDCYKCMTENRWSWRGVPGKEEAR